jgi:hypothetical protein
MAKRSTGSLEPKALRQQIGDGPLLWTFRPLVDDGGPRSKFIDHLAARAARRAWNSLIVSDGNGADLQFWTIFSDGGKDRGPLGAVGYSIGRILDVASHEDMAFRGENGGANLEMGERRVSILHDFARRTEQAFAHGS